MSPQAVVLGIVYAILVVILIISIIVTKAWAAIPSFLLMAAWLALMVYDTNCVSSPQQCTIWGWIRTVLFVLGPIATILMMLTAFFSLKAINNAAS